MLVRSFAMLSLMLLGAIMLFSFAGCEPNTTGEVSNLDGVIIESEPTTAPGEMSTPSVSNTGNNAGKSLSENRPKDDLEVVIEKDVK